jgi:hypothetical protein
MMPERGRMMPEWGTTMPEKISEGFEGKYLDEDDNSKIGFPFGLAGHSMTGHSDV